MKRTVAVGALVCSGIMLIVLLQLRSLWHAREADATRLQAIQNQLTEITKRLTSVNNSRREEAPVPTIPIALEGAHLKGSNAASVVMIEYADFQCPFCVRFAQQTLPAIEREFIETKRVRFGFRHLPSDSHPLAHRAAEAAECASVQGHFWEMYGQLLRPRSPLDEPGFLESARDMGLNLNGFSTCMTEARTVVKIDAEAAEAQALGITSTPTFFIGRVGPDGRLRVTRRITGSAQPAVVAQALKDVLDGGATEPR